MPLYVHLDGISVHDADTDKSYSDATVIKRINDKKPNVPHSLSQLGKFKFTSGHS